MDSSCFCCNSSAPVLFFIFFFSSSSKNTMLTNCCDEKSSDFLLFALYMAASFRFVSARDILDINRSFNGMETEKSWEQCCAGRVEEMQDDGTVVCSLRKVAFSKLLSICMKLSLICMLVLPAFARQQVLCSSMVSNWSSIGLLVVVNCPVCCGKTWWLLFCCSPALGSSKCSTGVVL